METEQRLIDCVASLSFSLLEPAASCINIFLFASTSAVMPWRGAGAFPQPSCPCATCSRESATQLPCKRRQQQDLTVYWHACMHASIA